MSGINFEALGAERCDDCGEDADFPVYLLGGTFCWRCYNAVLQADADIRADNDRGLEMEDRA